MLQELESRVLEVYRDLDAAVAKYAAQKGLACPAGCGHCCLSEEVEATILECIPLAFELFRSHQAELILKRLERDGDGGRCILYRLDFTEAGLWGCSQYGQRPVVCRLFGFAGNRDREGVPRLAMCRIMKEKFGDPPCSGRDEGDSHLPLFSEAGLRITALHPGLGAGRKPVNKALLEALQKVGMFLDLAAQLPTASDGAPEYPPDKPLLPHTPLRRRAS